MRFSGASTRSPMPEGSRRPLWSSPYSHIAWERGEAQGPATEKGPQRVNATAQG